MAKASEKSEERMRALAALSAISEAISRSLDLDETLRQVLEKVMEFLEVEIGALFLLDEEKRQAKLMVHRGLSEESVQVLNTLRVSERAIKALAKEVKRGKWVVMVDEVLKRTRLLKDMRAIITRERVQCYLPIFLRFREDILGGMVVASREAREFTPEEIDFSIAVGRQVGMAIENARLHEELRKELTERKRTEENVMSAVNEWAMTFDSMADGAEILSLDFEILNVNAALCKMLGKTKEELIGRKCYQVFHGKDTPISGCLLEKVKHSKHKESIEMFEPTLDAWLSVAASPILDEEGEVTRIVHLVRDISERKRAEEVLRESEGRYRAIFEQAADSVVLIDGETGALVEFNDRAHKSLGYTREEFEKLKIPDFEVIESVEEVAKHIEKIIKQGTDTFETRHRTKDGEIHDIQVSSRAISIGGRDFIQSIWRDITERKRAQEEISHRSKQLALINEVGQRIAPILELNELYQTVVESVQEKLGYQNVTIFSVRDDKVVLEAIAGPQAKIIPSGYTQKTGEGMVGWVAQTGKTLLANDVTKEPRFLHLEFLDVAAELDVPIKVSGNTIGVLLVDSDHPNAFTEADVTTLETIADQVARAIENARLYEQTDEKLRDRVAELTALNAMAQSLTSTLELDEIMESIAIRVAQLMRGRICTIRLVEGDELTIGAAVGYKDEPARQHRIKIDERLARIVQDQQPLLIEDLWESEGVPSSRRKRAKREGVHSFLGVPRSPRGKRSAFSASMGKSPTASARRRLDSSPPSPTRRP